MSPESVNRVRERAILILGVVLACSIGVGAILSGVRHMYIYAALTLIATVGGHLFNVQRHLRLILPGAAIMLLGIVVLMRFLHKYRIPAEEKPHGKS